MASESHTRDSGGSLGRDEVLRQRRVGLGRLGSVADSDPDSDEDSNSDDDEKKWHETKNLPFVDVGAEFSLTSDGIVLSFVRTGGREA